MADFPIDEFESLVRDFLADKKSWDDVHRFVIDSDSPRRLTFMATGSSTGRLKMGWETGIEPATVGATVRCSTS